MTTNRTGTGMGNSGMGSGVNETLGSNLEQKLDSLKEKAKDIVGQGSEKVDEIKHRVVDVKDRAMSRGNDFIDSMTAMIKANPLKSVFIAFGVGYLGMRLFRR